MLITMLLGFFATVISTLTFGPVITIILFIIANMVELLVLSYKEEGGKGIAICFSGFIPVIGFVLFGLLHNKDDSWRIALYSAISTIVAFIAVVIYMEWAEAGYYSSPDMNIFESIFAGLPFALFFLLPKKLFDC